MKINIIDLKGQYQKIEGEIKSAVCSALDSGQFILGGEVAKFEEEAASYNGVKSAIAVANGTDAILLALKALGVGYGDAVITSPFTYYATAGAIARCGARPVFCDIDPKTYNMDPRSLKAALGSMDKKELASVKAVVPVHIYGQAADMDEILKIAREYNLKVVGDAAQAFGAEYKSKKTGSMGDAGMIITNNEALADALRILRNQGNKEKYYHTVLGHNSRMDNVQGAILRVKLKYIDEWNERRRKLAGIYSKKLSGLNIKTPFAPDYNVHTYHLYVIYFQTKARKEKAQAFLAENGVDARTYYPVPLHLQECFGYLGYKAKDFPFAEGASSRTLAIPMYPELTEEQQDYIVDKIAQAEKEAA
ncbi:MAG: DegT/DnrJ/EryC1/StrS family aminotransferase [Candidatus Omnitrophota bacterium]